jgi:hypothetical protein
MFRKELQGSFFNLLVFALFVGSPGLFILICRRLAAKFIFIKNSFGIIELSQSWRIVHGQNLYEEYTDNLDKPIINWAQSWKIVHGQLGWRINQPFFLGDHNIGVKFSPPLAMTNLYRKICGAHKVWVLPSHPNFLHMHELRIEPLVTCLRVSILLPLGSIDWFNNHFFVGWIVNADLDDFCVL